MASLSRITATLATAMTVASAASRDTKQHEEVRLQSRRGEVVHGEEHHLTNVAPPEHSPWAYELGLYEHATPVLGLAEIASFPEAQSFTIAQGAKMARGHASGKTVIAEGNTDNSILHAYVCTLMLVATVVTVIYLSEGFAVISGILAYLLALSTMKIVVKWVFVVNDFQYPVWLTGTHMLASALVGFALLFLRYLYWNEELVVPTARELFFKFTPLASCIAGSIGAGNISLVFCSASFAEIVGATGPIVTVALILIMGLPFNFKLLLPTCVVVAGCALSVVGEMNFSPIGFALCFAANIGRAMKVVLQQELMTGHTKSKFDPSATLAWMCTCSFFIIGIWSAVSEGSAPYRRLQLPGGRSDLLAALLLSCVNAVILNLAALYVTKNLGAVGGQLVAQVKSVLTVLGGMAVFQETLSNQEKVGFAFVMIGTYAYTRTEKVIKEAAAAEKTMENGPSTSQP